MFLWKFTLNTLVKGQYHFEFTQKLVLKFGEIVEKERERETEREGGRDRDRQTDRGASCWKKLNLKFLIFDLTSVSNRIAWRRLINQFQRRPKKIKMKSSFIHSSLSLKNVSNEKWTKMLVGGIFHFCQSLPVWPDWHYICLPKWPKYVMTFWSILRADSF